MDPEEDLDGIMDRALRSACTECKAELPLRAKVCPACGAAVVEDESSALSVGDAAPHPATTASTVERRANYQLLQRATNGIGDGSMSMEEYQRAIKKLQQVSQNGLTICNSSSFQLRLQAASAEAQRAGEVLKNAFLQLQEGLDMLERYAQSGAREDLKMGRSLAEVAFAQLHEVEEASANLK